MSSAQILVLVLVIPLAYVLGSIPFGLIVGLAKGVDPRLSGSKNIGATNVGRLLGKKFFILVMLLDGLKSLLPMVATGWILKGSAGPMTRLTFCLWLGVGLAGILGHMFSCFLKFKGGKGVATSAGVILGLYPYYTLPAVAALLVWMAAYFPTRYVSLGSILAAVGFPIAYGVIGWKKGWPIWDEQLPLLLFAMLVAVLIVVKHRSNIQRLLAGKENRF